MQPPPTTHQLEHSNNKLTGETPSPTPQPSPPATGASSPGQGRAAKAVTPATVIAWLREHYKLGKHGHSKKAAVFAHYQALCAERGAESSISSTFFGKLVKRAFPEIKTIRKGPRGKVEQCYDRLKPVDPAKASRTRWLERVNLYLAALQASGANPQQPPPAASSSSHAPAPAARAQPEQRLLPPRTSLPLHQPHQHQHHHHHHQQQQQQHYTAMEGGAGVGQPDHHQQQQHYASSLDAGGNGGHYLASLLPSFDSPSPSSSFASSPAPSSPTSAELAHHHHLHLQAPHDHAQQPSYRGYESFEPLQPAAGAYDVAARQDNAPWQPQQPGLSRLAHTPAATMGFPHRHHHLQHHHHHHQQQVAAGPYTTLLAEDPSPLYAVDHRLDHAPFALYL